MSGTQVAVRTHDGAAFDCYVALPAGDEPTPAVVLASSIHGVDADLRDIAEIANRRGMNVEIGYGREGELMWNGLLRGPKAEQLASAQLARAKARNAAHLVTLYLPGTILQTMHWSWNATYSNAVVRDWLFRQVNDAPYVPAK